MSFQDIFTLDVDVLQPGNFGTLSLIEELMNGRLDLMIDHIKEEYGSRITVDQMEEFLKSYGLKYEWMPDYMKNKIDDEIDVIVG